MKKNIKVHWLQHVPFEGLGNIENWIKENNFEVSVTKLYENHEFPSHMDYDFLIIMGGPMSTYEESQYPFLVNEKRFISEAVANNKNILGICLGSQLLSDVLGGRVFPNDKKEIGWYPIDILAKESSTLFSVFEKQMTVFHWHGDTFTIPSGGCQSASSAACKNQAFEYNGGKIAGLQFHIEMDVDAIEKILAEGAHELVNSPFISTPQEIREGYRFIEENRRILYKFLDKIAFL